MSDSSDSELSTEGGAARSLEQHIRQLRQQIPPSVRLIAVTKTFPAAAVRAAYAAEIRDFGESKVQEAAVKQAELSDLADITWHLIGHLQTNKVRKAVQQFDWIHSVDSLKLAEKLDQAAGELHRRPSCCLQVKLADDPSKYGFDLETLIAALPQLDQLTHLRIVGLMTILPYGLSETAQRKIFERARQLAEEINQRGFSQLQIEHLSMGMSGDFAVAIAAGATMIRLGTALFGRRDTSL
ncbi:MAG: YggS family pyridoxal phosphate-dependent enzyme [Leptolyngbya sp. SIO4C1]|nr:YggS family pyridoxal phosphate-dependent enzyme [Leptolyngbya sp. SIO4C1]